MPGITAALARGDKKHKSTNEKQEKRRVKEGEKWLQVRVRADLTCTLLWNCQI
jgi:hypothetical protein